MDALIQFLLEYVDPLHMEMAFVSLATLAFALSVKFGVDNLRWEAPSFFTWSKDHWKDKRSDLLVKMICAPLPLIGDTFPLWAGTLAGWLFSPFQDPVTGACLGGSLVPLSTYLALGLRTKTNFQGQTRNALVSVRRLQSHMDRKLTRMERQVDSNATTVQNRLLDSIKIMQILESHGKSLTAVNATLTGDDHESLRAILMVTLDKELAYLRDYVKEEIEKCYTLIKATSPELDDDEHILSTESELVWDDSAEIFNLGDTQELPVLELDLDDEEAAPERKPKRKRRRRRV